MLASIPLFALALSTPSYAEPHEGALDLSVFGPFGPGLAAETAPTHAEGSAFPFSVSLYYSDLEFREVDGQSGAGSVTFLEVPRERIGAQFGFGPAYVRFYQETVDAAVLDTEFEGFGLGLGAQGAWVTHSNQHAMYFIDYDVSVDLGMLDEDQADAEILNLTAEGKVGPGFGVQWFRASAGLAASFTSGTLEVPGLADIDLDSQNLGFYASIGYLSESVPLKARLDVHLGDIGGFALSIGYSF